MKIWKYKKILNLHKNNIWKSLKYKKTIQVKIMGWISESPYKADLQTSLLWVLVRCLSSSLTIMKIKSIFSVQKYRISL